MPMKKLIISLLIILGSSYPIHSQYTLTDLHNLTVPNAVKFIPGPPDSLSLAFAYDVHQYMLGKTLRDTERGTEAWSDIKYGIFYTAMRLSAVTGIEISSSQTPHIYSLLSNGLTYISQSCGAAKTYYNRRRPFDRFNEPIFSNESPETLKAQGSYPSAHSLQGWAGALLMTEVIPSLQNTLFEQGFNYGESRVIVGAHWQSDVDDARTMASAGFSRLHSSEGYLELLREAQAEYDSLTHYQRSMSLSDLHPDISFMPSFPDSTSIKFANDITAYYQHKALRDSERGNQAIADDDMTTAGIAKKFAEIMGITIDNSHSPHIMQLLENGLAVAQEQCLRVKDGSHRAAPYQQLNDPTINVFPSHPGTSSYPSLHATIGWVTALMLIDVCPSYQNEILNLGREYGQSRVITGTNWQSDVDAGLLLGGMIFANLVSEPSFCQLLTKAREEYNALSDITLTSSKPHESRMTFSLDGRMATEQTTGIMVTSDGQKLLR